MKLLTLPISSITIGSRFREDMGNLDDLAASIKEKGLIQPITLDPSYNLLAGGRRIAAAEAAGLSEIPVIIRQVDGELDKREIELFENIHRKDMEWPERIQLTRCIHDLLKEKHGDDWSARSSAKVLNKSVGGVSESLKMAQALEILPELADEPTEDKARRKLKRIVENVEVAKALGEAKDLQKAKVLIWADSGYAVGDAIAGLKKFRAGSAHFAEVDPPYGIDIKKFRPKGENISEYTEVESANYIEFLREISKNIYKNLAEDTFCVWWFAPTWTDAVLTILQQAGFHVDDIPAIWSKVPGAVSSSNPDIYLARAYEPFYICRKGNPIIRHRGRPNVFQFQGVDAKARIHLTERPEALMREILITFCYPKARILVPFLGSGNTLIAAYHEGMTGYGWDLSKEMKNAFLARVQKAFPGDISEVQ